MDQRAAEMQISRIIGQASLKLQDKILLAQMVVRASSGG
jgi:hypothetical protein